MSALTKLWFLKIKSNIRNVFKKPSSAIFTVLMMIIYGALFASILFMDKTQITAGMMIDVHMSILIVLGFLALMIFMTIFSKKQALFFETDAFYLFGGPFTRKQVMQFLMSQTIMQSLLLGAVSLFSFAFTGGEVAFSGWFYIAIVLVNAVLVFFFSLLNDYVYILSITNKKYKNIARAIVVSLLALVVIILGITLVQSNFDINNGLLNFVESPLFYIVPMFGWAKMVFIGMVESSVVMIFSGLALLLLALMILYYFFTSFKGDFYEQALQDAIDFTAYYKKARAGKDVSKEFRKVKQVQGSFKEGAWAIFSKGMLQMRKVNGFLSLGEVATIGFYFIITVLIDGGFGFFVYMMVFWLFGTLQQSSLQEELKNYLIYLIPDDPLKKLIAVILPTLLKVCIVSTVAMIAAAIFYGIGVIEAIQYLITIYGYIMVFVSASVLATKILRSRNNAVMENMLRMLVIIVCSLPGAILMMALMMNPQWFSMSLMNIISYSSLAMNIIISIIIILSCKNMLKGRELNSD